MSRALIAIGLMLVLVGVLWPVIGKLGLGRLPGDIYVERPNFSCYFPIVTSLLISVVLNLVLWFVNRRPLPGSPLWLHIFHGPECLVR